MIHEVDDSTFGIFNIFAFRNFIFLLCKKKAHLIFLLHVKILIIQLYFYYRYHRILKFHLGTKEFPNNETFVDRINYIPSLKHVIVAVNFFLILCYKLTIFM